MPPHSWDELLAEPAFWASYYELMLDDDEADEADDRLTSRRVFGIDANMRFEAELHNHASATHDRMAKVLEQSGGDVERALLQLLRDDPFDELIPTYADDLRRQLEAARGPRPENKSLEIPLARGFSLSIEFAPGATLFHLCEGDERLLLGHHSGHQALPALRWEEVFEIERIAAREGRCGFSDKYVGLLLYATPWTAQHDDVRGGVREGVARAGVVLSDAIDPFVDRLVSIVDIECDPPEGGFRWWQQEPFGWVNNSPYGPRNPRSFFSKELQASHGFALLKRWASTREQS